MYFDFSKVKDYSNLTPQEKMESDEEHRSAMLQHREEEDAKDVLSDSSYDEDEEEDIVINMITGIELVTDKGSDVTEPDDIGVILTELSNVLNGVSNN